jgi:hypothetical protein
MLQEMNQTESRGLQWTCQAVSHLDESCDVSASYHCGICGLWLCTVHAEDEMWHHCIVEPGDEGGEG